MSAEMVGAALNRAEATMLLGINRAKKWAAFLMFHHVAASAGFIFEFQISNLTFLINL